MVLRVNVAHFIQCKLHAVFADIFLPRNIGKLHSDTARCVRIIRLRYRRRVTVLCIYMDICKCTKRQGQHEQDGEKHPVVSYCEKSLFHWFASSFFLRLFFLILLMKRMIP